MSSYRNLILIVLILLVLGGGLAIWNAERNASTAPPPETTGMEAGPEVVGRNVSFVVTEGEVKKWRLTADKAVYSESQTEADLTTVQGEFYNVEGQPVLKFSAPTGHYTNENNQVKLTGGVTVESLKEEGGQMRSPEMSWNAKSDEVVATGGVKLDFPQGKSTAQVARFTLDFSKINLEGGVTSVITSPQ